MTEGTPSVDVNWARWHRVAGLLAGLYQSSPGLQTAAYGQALHSARCSGEAERLYRRLSPRIDSLALIKGPALAVQAWPNPALRSYDDLDFLCARGDFPELLAGLRAAGYAPAIEHPDQLSHLWHFGWGIVFQHPDGFMVEVNHRFFPPHYPWPRGARLGLARGFQRLALDETEVLAPGPGLHLLLCCLHAVWHGWARLAWIVDIAGLVARHPDALERATELAESCPFAQRALAAGCAVADTILGPDLSAATAPRPVGQEALTRLEGQTPAWQGQELRQFHEQFMTRAERMTYRLRRILIPGDGDIRWIALPPPLRSLYWPLRLLRGLLPGKG